MNIYNYSELNSEQCKAIEDIFFESSEVKEFSSAHAKATFFDKYLGYYIKNSDFFFVGVENGHVLGYICGVFNSLEHDGLYSILAHYSVFNDDYSDYPAHLHINLHRVSRGLGLGSILIEHTIESLSQVNIKGIHLITSPMARNVSFYRNNLFTYSCVKNFQGADLLLLGRSI